MAATKDFQILFKVLGLKPLALSGKVETLEIFRWSLVVFRNESLPLRPVLSL